MGAKGDWIIKETELAQAVAAWLTEQHWDCYFEVQVYSLGRIADIVAVRGPVVYVIECKTSLSLKVLEQASLWRSHLRSIAVPKCKRGPYRSGDRKGAYYLARRCLEIGVLEVSKRNLIDGSEFWDVVQMVIPKLKRDYHPMAQQIRRALLPEHKTHVAPGSPSVEGRWTPYKSSIRSVRRFIRDNPGCTFREIGEELGKMHYANVGSAIGNLRQALMNWESDWCFVDQSSVPYQCFVREDYEK